MRSDEYLYAIERDSMISVRRKGVECNKGKYQGANNSGFAYFGCHVGFLSRF